MLICNKTSQSCVYEYVFWTSVYDSKDGKKILKKKNEKKNVFLKKTNL